MPTEFKLTNKSYHGMLSMLWSATCRPNMHFSEPTISSLEGFVVGYSLAIDQCGGRMFYEFYNDFVKGYLQIKFGTTKTTWIEIIKDVAEQERLDPILVMKRELYEFNNGIQNE